MLDGTLIIQICNFFVVWLLSYFIVLKPTFALIAQQQEYDLHISQESKKMHEQMDMMQQSIDTLWYNLHTSCKGMQKNKSMLPQLAIDYTPHAVASHVNPQSLVQEAKKIIIQKVIGSV